MLRLAQRLTRNVMLVGECHEWARRRDRNGYGALNVWVPGLLGRAHLKAHIVSWLLTHADTDLETIDDLFLAYKELTVSGLHIDHVCRRRACLNPDPQHLEVVTHTVNYERRDTYQNANRGKN